MKDLNRNVSLICRTCGNNMFETLDANDDLLSAPDNTRFRCSDCKRVYTKKELIEENEEVINANIDEIKEEAIAELKNELNKSIRRIKI